MSKEDIQIVIKSQLSKLSGHASRYYYLVEKQIGDRPGSRYEVCGEIDIDAETNVYEEVESMAAESWGFGKFRLCLYDAESKRVPEMEALRVNIRGVEISNGDPGRNPFHNAASFDPVSPIPPMVGPDEIEDDPIEEDERYYDQEVRLARSKLAALREKKRFDEEMMSLGGGGAKKENDLMSLILQMQMNQQRIDEERRRDSDERMGRFLEYSSNKNTGFDKIVELLPVLVPLVKEVMKPKDPMESTLVKILMEKAFSPREEARADPLASIMPEVIGSVTSMYNGLTEKMVENMLQTKTEQEKDDDQNRAMQRFREVKGMIKEIAPVIGKTLKEVLSARSRNAIPAQETINDIQKQVEEENEKSEELQRNILQDFISQYESEVDPSKILTYLLEKYPKEELYRVSTDPEVISVAESAGDKVAEFLSTVAVVTKE